MDTIKEVLTDLWKAAFPDVEVESLTNNETFNTHLKWGMIKYITTRHQPVTAEDFQTQFPELKVEQQPEEEQQQQVSEQKRSVFV